jgi:hypothetical protein
MKKWQKYPLFLIVSLIFSFTMACGDGGKNEGTKDKTKNLNSSDIVPCELLTAEQVETVLPGADEGYTAMSGGSLMEGVDSYQCSYTNEKYNIFTAIVHVAATGEDFDWIKPKESISNSYEDARELNIGDGGWLYGTPDDMKVEVAKGYTVIELHLMSDNAKEKGNALVELASILVKKI